MHALKVDVMSKMKWLLLFLFLGVFMIKERKCENPFRSNGGRRSDTTLQRSKGSQFLVLGNKQNQNPRSNGYYQIYPNRTAINRLNQLNQRQRTQFHRTPIANPRIVSPRDRRAHVLMRNGRLQDPAYERQRASLPVNTKENKFRSHNSETFHRNSERGGVGYLGRSVPTRRMRNLASSQMHNKNSMRPNHMARNFNINEGSARFSRNMQIEFQKGALRNNLRNNPIMTPSHKIESEDRLLCNDTNPHTLREKKSYGTRNKPQINLTNNESHTLGTSESYSARNETLSSQLYVGLCNNTDVIGNKLHQNDTKLEDNKDMSSNYGTGVEKLILTRFQRGMAKNSTEKPQTQNLHNETEKILIHKSTTKTNEKPPMFDANRSYRRVANKLVMITSNPDHLPEDTDLVYPSELPFGQRIRPVKQLQQANMNKEKSNDKRLANQHRVVSPVSTEATYFSKINSHGMFSSNHTAAKIDERKQHDIYLPLQNGNIFNSFGSSDNPENKPSSSMYKEDILKDVLEKILPLTGVFNTSDYENDPGLLNQSMAIYFSSLTKNIPDKITPHEGREGIYTTETSILYDDEQYYSNNMNISEKNRRTNNYNQRLNDSTIWSHAFRPFVVNQFQTEREINPLEVPNIKSHETEPYKPLLKPVIMSAIPEFMHTGYVTDSQNQVLKLKVQLLPINQNSTTGNVSINSSPETTQNRDAFNNAFDKLPPYQSQLFYAPVHQYYLTPSHHFPNFHPIVSVHQPNYQIPVTFVEPSLHELQQHEINKTGFQLYPGQRGTLRTHLNFHPLESISGMKTKQMFAPIAEPIVDNNSTFMRRSSSNKITRIGEGGFSPTAVPLSHGSHHQMFHFGLSGSFKPIINIIAARGSKVFRDISTQEQPNFKGNYDVQHISNTDVSSNFTAKRNTNSTDNCNTTIITETTYSKPNQIENENLASNFGSDIVTSTYGSYILSRNSTQTNKNTKLYSKLNNTLLTVTNLEVDYNNYQPDGSLFTPPTTDGSTKRIEEASKIEPSDSIEKKSYFFETNTRVSTIIPNSIYISPSVMNDSDTDKLKNIYPSTENIINHDISSYNNTNEIYGIHQNKSSELARNTLTNTSLRSEAFEKAESGVIGIETKGTPAIRIAEIIKDTEFTTKVTETVTDLTTAIPGDKFGKILSKNDTIRTLLGIESHTSTALNISNQQIPDSITSTVEEKTVAYKENSTELNNAPNCVNQLQLFENTTMQAQNINTTVGELNENAGSKNEAKFASEHLDILSTEQSSIIAMPFINQTKASTTIEKEENTVGKNSKKALNDNTIRKSGGVIDEISDFSNDTESIGNTKYPVRYLNYSNDAKVKHNGENTINASSVNSQLFRGTPNTFINPEKNTLSEQILTIGVEKEQNENSKNPHFIIDVKSAADDETLSTTDRTNKIPNSETNVAGDFIDKHKISLEGSNEASKLLTEHIPLRIF